MLCRVIARACTQRTHTHTHVSLFGTNCPNSSCIRRYRCANVIQERSNFIFRLLVQTQHKKLLAMKVYVILENILFLTYIQRLNAKRVSHKEDTAEKGKVEYRFQGNVFWPILYSLLSCAACQVFGFRRKKKTDLSHTIDCFCGNLLS